MHHDVAIVYNYPPITSKALLLSLLIMGGFHVINNGVSKRVDHTITGAATNNEIVCKRDNFFQVN